MNTLEETNSVLLENILVQAKYFLDNADEFYPFGSVIDNKGELKPMGAYTGVEHPDSVEAFNLLEKGVKLGIEKKKYLAAAIGTDVFLSKETGGEIEKRTAIQIRFYSSDPLTSDKYFYYFHSENGYSFEETWL